MSRFFRHTQPGQILAIKGHRLIIIPAWSQSTFKTAYTGSKCSQEGPFEALVGDFLQIELSSLPNELCCATAGETENGPGNHGRGQFALTQVIEPNALEPPHTEQTQST